MIYTVSDYYNTFKEHLQIVAGSGGMSNPVTACGLLDYELIPELKEAYFQSNFHEHQLILTSLVYTRDNPYGILDAVKHLASKGCSGLVIKNVFRLPISESIVRYADAKNFPLFLIPVRGLELSFEDIIYTVNRRSELQQHAEYHRSILDRLMAQDLRGEEASLCAMQLNPSFRDRFFAVFAQLDEFMSDRQKLDLMNNYINSDHSSFEDFAGLLEDGLILIKSSDQLQNYYTDFYIDGMLDSLGAAGDVTAAGISDMHHSLEDLGEALKEAFFAARYQNISPGRRRYSELGSYRLLFQICDEPHTRSYVRRVLDPIEEYDSMNRGSLMETLEEYVKADCDMAKAAAVLSQHEQTIRYRLNRIFEITDLDRKSYEDMQQLVLACRLKLARQAMTGSGPAAMN
ncbi:MAG: PucR family transcriptional regulator ligand-binding domain-containing protein [Firmicutes bacterium]|nr:PucR family transcriptional regulator ligand-binding domain-containing protein [Bacillota bacterium]